MGFGVMNSQLLLLLISIPVLFLCFLLLRLAWLILKRRNQAKSAPLQRDLLFDTLHETTLKEREARRLSDANRLALEALDIKHRAIMENLPLGVLVIDQTQGVTYVSAMVQQLLGQDIIVGWPLESLLEELREAILQWRNQPEMDRAQIDISHEKGVRYLSIILSKMPDQQELILINDSTTERSLEERVRAKRDLELMGELAGGVTHEVKNALAAIQGRVQLIPYGNAEEHGEHIMSETKRLLAFVQDFMKSSKGGPLELESFSAHEWFEEMRHWWDAHPLGDHASFINPADGLSINGDRERLTVLARNLVLNGLQACVEPTEEPWAATSIEAVQGGLILKVIDQGPGFTPESRQKMFVPFVSSKEKGSGMGLFQCRRIVLEHGGRIEVSESTPTTITCFIPNQEGF